jgi:spermidine/putrescine transport system substrate-binding protein
MTDLNPFTSPVSGVRPTGLSRRGFLRGVGATGAAAAGAGLLAACGDDEGGETTSSGNDEKILNFANWPLYIDTKRVDGEKTYPTLEAFESETGIQVNYSEPVNDNEEYFAKIRPILAADKDVGVDSFVLTDPNRDYSVPWQSGVTGIAYDASKTDPVTTMTDLFTRSDLSGQVTALKEMRDTMGLILLDQGSNPADFTEDEWASAIASLTAAVDSNQIRQFTGNNYAQLLAQGTIKACVAWSGDIIQLQFDNPDIKFVIPDAGGMLWSDNMLIPNNAQHKANAEAWMNYYYDPKVAAELAAWVNYICPVDGAQDEMDKIDPDLAKNPLIFPSQDDYAQLAIFRALTDDEETQFAAEYQQITV